MRISFLIGLFLLTINISLIYSQPDQQIIIGQKHSYYSEVLQENREYWIALPESYHDEGTSYKNYPLLIILDGHIYFHSFSGLVQLMSGGRNGNRKIPEMIVVSILNVDRERDFTPDKIIMRRENNTGGGDRFLAFLEKELIPELDRQYRTNSFRVLFGHSLGGLLATHAYMKDTTLFQALIAADPSLGAWDETVMDEKIERVGQQIFDRTIYFATADAGKRNLRNRDRHVRLYESLRGKCDGEFKAKLKYYEDEDHGSVPLIAFYEGLSFIFSGYVFSYREINERKILEQHYHELSKRLGFKFLPPEALVNRAGYYLLRSQEPNEQSKALDLFLLNTENYPESYHAFDSLGDAYSVLGDRENAIRHFKRSLELNPDNEHAKSILEKISKEE